MADLSDRGKTLEEKFFRDLDRKKLEKLQAEKEQQATKDTLRTTLGITDDEVVDKLVALGMSADTIAAMSLVPLVEVAWADGDMDKREEKAILQSAEEQGIDKDGSAYALLSQWLTQKPDDALLAGWVAYIQALAEHLTPEERSSLKEQVIGGARVVAEAAGGFLGIAKISDSETRMLARLSAAFDQ